MNDDDTMDGKNGDDKSVGGMKMARSRNRWQERRQEAQRRRFTAKGRRKVGLYALAGMVVVLVIVIAAYYGLRGSNDLGSAPEPAQNPQSGNDTTVVTVPVNDVGSSAKYYTYDSGGTIERFFLVKGPDGNIHVAMDACDVCYPAKKGYKQSGDKMVCNNCGKSYSINSLGTDNTAGGCWPSHIAMKIMNGNVAMKKTDLDTKAYLFR